MNLTPTCDTISVTDANRGTHPATLTNYINWINEDVINKGQNVKLNCDVPDNTGLILTKDAEQCILVLCCGAEDKGLTTDEGGAIKRNTFIRSIKFLHIPDLDN